MLIFLDNLPQLIYFKKNNKVSSSYILEKLFILILHLIANYPGYKIMNTNSFYFPKNLKASLSST